MIAISRRIAIALYWGLSGLAAIALLVLPDVLVPLWDSKLIVFILILLACGALGVATQVKLLMSLGKAGSWLMLIYLVVTAIPDHEYFREHSLPYPSIAYLLTAFAVLALIPVGLLVLHRSLSAQVGSKDK